MNISNIRRVVYTNYCLKFLYNDYKLDLNDVKMLINAQKKISNKFELFNYVIDNFDKLTKEEFLNFYHTFYQIDKKELLKQMSNILFKDIVIENIKTNEKSLNSPNYYKYRVIKDTSSYLDNNKIYSLKEIQSLIDKGLILFTGDKSEYKLINSPIKDDIPSLLNYVDSSLEYELIKKEFTKDKLVNDYNEILLNYRNNIDDIHKSLTQLKFKLKDEIELKKSKLHLDNNKLLSYKFTRGK